TNPPGQSVSCVHPGSLGSHSPVQKPPQPSEGSSPQTLPAQLAWHSQTPHSDRTVPQPVPTGSTSHSSCQQTSATVSPKRCPLPNPQTMPAGQPALQGIRSEHLSPQGAPS